MTADINELRRRMDGALKSLHTEFGGLRTGRANAAQGKGKFTVIKDK